MTRANQQIVVTGAAGFIGANVVQALNSRGHDNLLLVDRLGSDQRWKNLLECSYEDLVSPESFLQCLKTDALGTPLAVVHLGACSATTEANADYLLENNYRYTRTLCQWCLDRGVRFVYASSAATYGDGALGYSDDDRLTPRLRPLNMYGYSKHMFDLWALRRGLMNRIAGLKYFNVFGPLEDHKADMRSVVHKSFEQIGQRGYVELFKSHRADYADGEQKRDFIYVKDAVAVTLWFMDHPDRNGLFNCGSGLARSWNDLAKAAFAAMNRPADIRYIDMPPALRGKYQYFTQADLTKLRSAGYDARFTSLEEAVEEYACRTGLRPPRA